MNTSHLLEDLIKTPRDVLPMTDPCCGMDLESKAIEPMLLASVNFCFGLSGKFVGSIARAG